MNLVLASVGSAFFPLTLLLVVLALALKSRSTESLWVVGPALAYISVCAVCGILLALVLPVWAAVVFINLLMIWFYFC